MTELVFTQNGQGAFEAEYEGKSGALQILCDPGTEIFVMGDAGAGQYHNLDGGTLRGGNFLFLLDMRGLVKVKIVCSNEPKKVIVNEI